MTIGKAKKEFQVGDLIHITGTHPWRGDMARVVPHSMNISTGQYLLALIRDDAMDGHQVFASHNQMRKPYKRKKGGRCR